MQDKDTESKALKDFLAKKGKLPPKFRPVAKYLREQDGLVGFVIPPRKGYPRDDRFRLYPPAKLHLQLLRQAHDESTACHGGHAATVARLRERFWWPGIHTMVQKFLKHCKICDATKSRKVVEAPIKPLQVPTRPNQRIHADLWGPHKTTDGIKKYVCVITDALTKIVRLTVIPDKTAHCVADSLLDWCVIYGVPEEVVTDNGGEFKNEVVQGLWDRLRVRHKTTTPYHPRANGQCERFNRSMNKFLERMIAMEDCATGEWPAFIPALMMSYNTAVHKGTRVSPFEAMFGYTPNAFHWPNIDDVIHSRKPTTVKEDPLARLMDDRAEIRDTAKDALYLQQQHMLRASENGRKNASKRWKPKNGEQVWVRRTDTTDSNPSLKLKVEPGTVLRMVQPDVFEVSRTKRGKNKKATLGIDLLRPKISDVPEDDPCIQDLDNGLTYKDECKLPQTLEPEEIQAAAIKWAAHVDSKFWEAHSHLTDLEPQKIAEIRVRWDTHAQAAFEQAIRPWKEKHIPYSVCLPLPLNFKPRNVFNEGRSSDYESGDAAATEHTRTLPRSGKITPQPCHQIPTTPGKPHSPPGEYNITEDTEASNAEDTFSADFAQAPTSPPFGPPITRLSVTKRLQQEAARFIGHGVFPKRTRNQNKRTPS